MTNNKAKQEGCDLIIAATDNNRSRFNLNTIGLASKTPSILRWYGARIPKRDDCPFCGQSVLTDTVEDDTFG